MSFTHQDSMHDLSTNDSGAVAITGMAGRFPGARDIEEFWLNLCRGVDSIERFEPAGLDPAVDPEIAGQLNYVRARAILAGADEFDAAFFGMYPAEAELADPQHRVFLECAWRALEDAGNDPAAAALTGVFAGSSPSTYFLANVCGSREFLERYTNAYQVGNYTAMLGANTDFLATRVSYKLDLKGPSFTVQAGCATSLLAVSQACQSLLAYQCDQALAGGVSISFPQRRGYLYEEGGMVSPDGRCRPFDAQAQGTVFGSGAGVVALKRLEDALNAGDRIYAVIRGCGVNNDGSSKVGFAAPSVDGQAAVIVQALAAAGVPASSVSYVEAHGTATPLGDPIEVAALTRAFRTETAACQFCLIGSVKGNVGHLDAASGVTGLIKTALALYHRRIPQSLHFERPNPRLDLENSPFRVVAETMEWPAGVTPRRAGVSALGVGGTNVHVVLEEAPVPAPAQVAEPVQALAANASAAPHLLVLSAPTSAALERMRNALAGHLQAHPALALRDAAFTLQNGRRHFAHRYAAVVQDATGAAQALACSGSAAAPAVPLQRASNPGAAAAFLFTGQGAPYEGMGAGLYRQYRLFRETVDSCAAILRGLPSGTAPASLFPHDLRSILYPRREERASAAVALAQTGVAQPALFVTGYALARLWMHWGIRPAALLGHSAGELTAACLAGVFSLEDGLAMIAERGRLMQALPAGAMLAVRLPEEPLLRRLPAALSLAAVNGPAQCVVAGPVAAIAAFERELGDAAVACRRLVVSHAFHSTMMEPAVAPFAACVVGVKLNPPRIPLVSSVTGGWLTDEQACDPGYWARHLRATVRFGAALERLRPPAFRALIEIGPGNALTALARRNAADAALTVTASLPDRARAGRDPRPEVCCAGQAMDQATLLEALGAVWTAGIDPDWHAVGEPAGRRISLPGYVFARDRFWIAPPAPAHRALTAETTDVPEPMTVIPETAVPSIFQASISQASVPLPPASGEVVPRRARLATELGTLFEEFSSVRAADIDPAKTFLELGFDSLFLTQITQAIYSRWKVKVTFRKIMEECDSLGALASYLDPLLPADVPPAARPAALAEAAPATASAPWEQALHQQIAQFSAQLFDSLRATAGPPAATPAATAAGPHASRGWKTPAANTPSPASASAFQPFGPYKPAQTGPAPALTARQEAHLATLTSRYNARTAASKALTARYRSVLADPRAAAGFRKPWKDMIYPVVSVRSKGARFTDADGNEYIDLVNGYGPIFFGHLPDFLEAALLEQLHKGIETGPQSPLAGEVAELVAELTGMERVTFCNTGSEAVMAALRVARTVTGRSDVAMFAGDYHGTFDEVLAKPVRRDGRLRSTPIAPGILQAKVDHVVVLDYGTPESLAFLREHAGELAAVLVEPVQSRHPELQPVEFLRAVRAITAQSGTALIFDEVVTGFRAHPGGVQALFGIRADLATYGKVVAGGMPIGIVAGSAAYMDALDGGGWSYGDDSIPEVGVTFFAGTFVRHPLALAAARAVLLEMKRQGPGLQENLNRRTAAFAGRLNALFAELGVPTRAATFSSFFYFSFPAGVGFGSLLYFHLRDRGIHIQEGFPCFLTTAHTDDDLDCIERAFRASVRELQASDLLPRLTEESFPLTEAQTEIWLAAAMCEEASCAFNETFTLRMRGALDRVALRSALDQLLSRHDALRSIVNAEGTRFTVRPHRLLAPALAPGETDLQTWNEPDRERAVAAFLESEARTPFDLARGPLVRTHLLSLTPEAHMLAFTSHHLVCDGWSTNVLLEELGQLYTAAVTGQSAALAPAVSFAGYAAAESARPDAGRDTVEQYWLRDFAQLPQALNLPLDRARPAVRSYAGATYRHRVGAEPYRAIKRAGAAQGCTLFVTLLAGFQALLARLSNQEELVVGIPTAGQSLLEDGALVGHCVNFLPVRGNVPAGISFAQLAAQVKHKLLDAYDHQACTYGTLVRKLAMARDPARPPLVDVQFNVERIGKRLEMRGLDAFADPAPKCFVNFDLFLNIVESDDGLTLDCDFHTGLFDRTTVARWMEQLETLLAAFAADATQPVTQPLLISAAERHLVLEQWVGTATAYPREASLASLFAAQAAQTPEAIALAFQRTTLTYRELDRRANQLGRYLVAASVHPGQPVAVCLDRSLDAIVAILAILKAGAAYVPLDPDNPPDRLRLLLADCAPTLTVTHSVYAAKLPADANLVLLDGAALEIARLPDAPLDARLTAAPGGDRLAYIMYTSGSTGRPKGVLIPHRAVVRLVRHTNYAALGPDEVFLQLAPLSFDAATFEIWAPLLNGGRLVLMPPGLPALEEIGTAIATQGITTLWLTAGLFHSIVDQQPGILQPLRQLLAGGDVLSPAHVQRFLEAAPGCRLINGYGPTEGTTFTCCHTVDAAEAVGGGPVPIGRPVSNTTVYVLDPHRQPVPVGVAGELYAGGDGLALGYLNQPERTAESFVSVPLPDGVTVRLYRTGDRARYRADGALEFLGRADTQIKMRGYRIEAGEIETVLRQFPGIRDAAVLARADRNGNRRLVAYLVGHRDAASPESSSAEPLGRQLATGLRVFLQQRLPEYMVPAAFVFLPELPLTANGKLDRHALPEPPEERAATRPCTPPSRPFEAELHAIWKRVLPAERIGVDDNLFEIGGDSLAIFKITGLAVQEGLLITPKDVFQHRTIRGISRLLAERGASGIARHTASGNGAHEPDANGLKAKPTPVLAPVSRSSFRRDRTT